MLTVESRTFEKKVPVRASCDNCGSLIDSFEHDGSLMLRDAVTLAVQGGYDMYFDGPDGRLDFCRTCVEALLVAFPCFKKVMVEY